MNYMLHVLSESIKVWYETELQNYKHEILSNIHAEYNEYLMVGISF